MSAATARVSVIAIGWKPKGIARPQELLLINRADLERAGDTQDELLGPNLVRPRAVIGCDRQLERQDLRPMRPPFRQQHLPGKPRLGREGSTLARAKEPGAWRLRLTQEHSQRQAQSPRQPP